ncbi:MAG TPA: CvpA family protein [Casimicrobiaceae bacterium]|nr:CvpA family protein [Casimicrobiaceae bacterium]
MTPFDLAILATILLSTLLAFIRGVVRELIALVAWVVGFVGAFAFAPTVGGWIPEIPGYPAVRYLIAFAAILIAALVLGALIAAPLARVIHAAGLGFVDRFLGSIFGVARGLLVILGFVLVAGLTALPRADWWQNSALAPPFVVGALALKPWLPERWAERLDYSRGGASRASTQKV